jgi:peptide/nickel transport system permease protein
LADKTNNVKKSDYSFKAIAWSRFKSDKMAILGLSGIIILFILALSAPLLANGRPLIFVRDGSVTFPFLRYIFAPDTTETFIEKVFNFMLLFIPPAFILHLFLKKHTTVLLGLLLLTALVLAIPFFTVPPKLDKTNWHAQASILDRKNGDFAVFTLIPYGPYAQIGEPYEIPSAKHWLGTDQIGRDVTARMLYGARVSLAVGLFATGLALVIGTIIGMCAGYFRGRFDLVTMRIVEIILCFPTFLLLLILMSLLKEYKFEQSILLVIMVLGMFGWIGLCRLVRGETLKQRILPYISSCEATGLPVWRIMLFHLLPNVSGVILISFTFGVAGAIVSESSLSFLGFGVQAPTASWGSLLRQAFSDPFTYWHLTVCPGAALFLSVCAFNFAGEGLRKVFNPKG